MSQRVAHRRGWVALRGFLAACLSGCLACAHEPREYCALLADPTSTPSPSLPSGFGELDQALIQRTLTMNQAARTLRGSLARSFRIYYAEETLPLLCGRLEQARLLAVGGRAREAGLKYQALLVAVQVVELAVALHAFSEYADRVGVPGFRIVQAQELFAQQHGPLLEAALSEVPGNIDQALRSHGAHYGAWVAALARWAGQIGAQADHLKVAKLVWDCAMLVAAVYDAAGAAAELAAAGRPPMPPVPAFAGGSAAPAIGMTGAAYVELTEALRRLIAAGALDSSIVVGLSTTLGGGGASMSAPELPGPVQAATPSNIEGLEIRKDVTLSGGRSGERVKELVGPPNSAVRGGEGRAFITDAKGRVIRDVTNERVKDVTPTVGFGPKRVPTPVELQILQRLWEDGP